MIVQGEITLITSDYTDYEIDENHDIAIAMSSRAHPVLPWLDVFKWL